LVLAVSSALVLASCGGGGSTTIIKSVTSQPTTSTSATTTAPTTSSSTTVPASVRHLQTFQADGGNIGCVASGRTMRCDIRKRSWSPPARPSSCPKEVDFGQGIEVGTSNAQFVCAGDTALNPSAPSLVSGQATEGAGVVCTAVATLITCTNQSTGHGFTMSSASYKLF
jgi:hypothetical protein